MNSGTFHVMSQDWRYFSREKSIIHTLHLGQLPPSGTAETVLIAKTPPASFGGGGSFNVPPLQLPVAGGSVENVTFTINVLSTCYGAVGINKKVLVAKGVSFEFGAWRPDEMTFYATVAEAGRYYFYIEAQGDHRDPSLGYFGPIDPATSPPTQSQAIRCAITKTPFGFSVSTVCSSSQTISQVGPFDGSVVPLHWGPSLYITTTRACRAHGFALLGANQVVRWTGNLLGNEPDAYVSGYLFKINDI